jgi:hypothetical protein
MVFPPLDCIFFLKIFTGTLSKTTHGVLSIISISYFEYFSTGGGAGAVE